MEKRAAQPRQELLGVPPSEKGKGAHEPRAQMARAYPVFRSCLGVLLLSPGRDASPWQGNPPWQYVAGTHLYSSYTWVKPGTKMAIRQNNFAGAQFG